MRFIHARGAHAQNSGKPHASPGETEMTRRRVFVALVLALIACAVPGASRAAERRARGRSPHFPIPDAYRP